MKFFQKAVWLVLGIELCILIFALMTFQVDDMTLSKGKTYDFNQNWTILREDGTIEPIEELPYTSDCKAGETVTIENTIPQEYWGMTLSFLSADKTLEVSVDGNIIYEFGLHDKKAFGHTPGSVTNFIDIPENLTEGKIQIKMTSPYDNYAANVGTMTIARRDTAILLLLKSNLFNFVCNILMLISGILLAFIALVRRTSGKGTDGLEYLCIFCLITCVYYFIETKTLNVFYGNQTIYSMLIFLILMTMPVLMLLYYEQNLLVDFKKRFQVLLILAFLNIAVQLIMQLLNIRDFMDMASFSHGMIFLTIVVGLKSFYDALKKKQDKSFRLEFLALLGMGLGSIFDLIRSYTVKVGDFGKYSRLGMTFFCLVMAGGHILKIARNYSDSLLENARLLKEENEQLVLAKNQALAANEAKSSFLANMSHEIRTPINAVLGMDAMIIKESKDQNITEYALDIQSAGNNLLSIINDILDFSKIESGKMEIIPVEYELSSLLNDSYNMIFMRAKEKNLGIQVKNDKTIPKRLYGDEVRIRQIINNLLTNAIKYTEKGQVILSADWKKLSEKKMMLSIAVKDTGIGITEENQKKLFSSFQRVDEKRNRNIEGTGLGLNITKQLVEMMGGTISLESEYGKGSTFSVELPQDIVSEQPMGEFNVNSRNTMESAKSSHKIFRAPKAHILVVDDVPMNLKVIRNLLKETGIQIDTAESGKQCLEMIKERKYDMIFVDHMMPEMDGVETLYAMKMEARNQNIDTPVIMLTANAIMGAKEEYLQEGFSGYLSKPVREQELEKTLLEYLPDELIEKEDADIPAAPEGALDELTFLDTETGMAYCAGMEEMYVEMLATYLENDRQKALTEYYQSMDLDNYRIQVHALKSTSLTIGAVTLSKLAEQMEHAAKEGNVDFIKTHQDEMMHQYIELLEKLKIWLEKRRAL
ncbi:MAG: ATP-binding protein [Lachnospiraceae bacterium]|nr:ATP-binding protein [Lachnospiraceae bacterium]